MNKTILIIPGFLMLLTSALVQAAPRPGDVGPGDRWQQNPYDFTFGNHIDTHVQLRLKTKMGMPDSLSGSFYIIFTDSNGVPIGTDPVSGLPIARHPRGADHDEVCGTSPNITCVVGWYMDGVPGNAKFVSHSGINGDDHPLWLVNRAVEGTAPAADMVIPQPGSFTHFHWITSSGTDPRAVSPGVSAECDKQNAGQLQDQAPSAVDSVCQGWFLQIQAVREFALEHGGEHIPVRLGMDNRSHLNLLTNFNNDVVITPTR